MALEQLKAEMLRGYMFFHHPDTPTLGVLRLDTENERHFVLVTKKALRLLSEELAKHADELEEVQ